MKKNSLLWWSLRQQNDRHSCKRPHLGFKKSNPTNTTPFGQSTTLSGNSHAKELRMLGKCQCSSREDDLHGSDSEIRDPVIARVRRPVLFLHQELSRSHLRYWLPLCVFNFKKGHWCHSSHSTEDSSGYSESWKWVTRTGVPFEGEHSWVVGLREHLFQCPRGCTREEWYLDSRCCCRAEQESQGGEQEDHLYSDSIYPQGAVSTQHWRIRGTRWLRGKEA